MLKLKTGSHSRPDPTRPGQNRWPMTRRPSSISGENTHTQPFYNHFLGLCRWASARRRNLLDFMVQGKITEADTPTIWLGATPPGLISDAPPSSPHFYAGCPSCRNPPNLSWLETGTIYAALHTTGQKWKWSFKNQLWHSAGKPACNGGVYSTECCLVFWLTWSF